jgi:hypothetical protein
MKKRIIWISLSAIVIIAGIILIYVFNKPRNSISDLPTDFTVEAPRLVDEFKTDDEKANAKYLEKVIEVSGVIAEINISDNGTGSNCILRQTNEISGVICEFEPGKDKELKNYQIGDNVTIKGKYSGFLMDVVLNTCEITE